MRDWRDVQRLARDYWIDDYGRSLTLSADRGQKRLARRLAPTAK